MDFQNVNPELFIVVGELLGNVIANELPFNVQNAVGNWLQLVGQAIETYNAQQQYYQQGPGRYFTPDSFNVDNKVHKVDQLSVVQVKRQSKRRFYRNHHVEPMIHTPTCAQQTISYIS